MMPTLYIGSVAHARRRPVEHAFKYRLAMLAVGVDELERVGRHGLVLGYNRPAALVIRDRDYLDPDDRPLREKLAARMPGLDPGRTIIVTSPRTLLPAFNPVTFYFQPTGSSTAALGAEVSNTFGERFFYHVPLDRHRDGAWVGETPKSLYVSPFHGVSGSYRFRLSLREERLAFAIDLWVGDSPLICTALTATARPLPRQPFSAPVLAAAGAGIAALPRIFFQGLRLRGKGMRPVMKPRPPSGELRRRDPS